MDDFDIKIAGDKPSKSINVQAENPEEISPLQIENAKQLGKILAEKFMHETEKIAADGNDEQMLFQRKLLLSFTVTVALDEFCVNDSISGIAQKSFLDSVRKESLDIYKTCSDTGAFSFYYLAYRRENDIDRRIGQTFAMLCSHDGDPIFQELGEALFCWFSAVVKKETANLNFSK